MPSHQLAVTEHFSIEWGFQVPIHGGTKGKWMEYKSEDIFKKIISEAAAESLTEIGDLSRAAEDIFNDSKNAIKSIISCMPTSKIDSYVVECLDSAKRLCVPDIADLRNKQLRALTVTIRDVRAVNGGTQLAPHQSVYAETELTESRFIVCRELSKICINLAKHLERMPALTANDPKTNGMKIFIGHGHSQDWKVVKDYLQGTLGLECDEFNRTPIAGKLTVDRLRTMLDDAQFAIIVMTGEDETTDGEIRARENVVHEAGLYQGRLGFENTIIIAEDYIDVFSNIEGLGRIDYPKGQIKSTLGELTSTLLERGVNTPIFGK